MLNINRRDLWQGLGRLTQNDWIKAGYRLNLTVDTKGGKGSHIAIRDPKFTNPAEIDGLIATISRRLARIENQSIFKHFLEYGIPEDDIWKALKML